MFYRLLVECASEVWDPHLVKSIIKLEDDVQRRAVRLICCLRGVESVIRVREKLELDLLQDHCKNNARLKLPTNILSCDVHSSLADNFACKTVKQISLHNRVTRLASLSARLAILANNSFYQFSFLPRTSAYLGGSTSYSKWLPLFCMQGLRFTLLIKSGQRR